MKNEREAVAGLLLRLRELGVTNHNILSAFEKIPRHNFVPTIYMEDAYNLGQFPIECGQVMTSVDNVARSLSALDVQPENKVLELGTGTAYQTAVLSMLAKNVISVDRFRTLCEKATTRLEVCGIKNARIIHADGELGKPDMGLYDRIISNCSFPERPKKFLDQLSSNGIMIAAIGPADNVQSLEKLTKIGSRFEVETLFDVRFQPFFPGKAKAI